MAAALWNRLSESDLDEIFLHIANNDKRVSNAKHIDKALRRQADKIAAHFSRGHVIGTDRSDIRKGLRAFPYQKWVFLFESVGKTIQVLAVVDGRRDYSRVFSERGE